MSTEIKDLTDRVIKEHRPVETHWHGEGPYHCTCGAEMNAVSEDALRWIFQFHCVSEGIALAQREIERLLAQEREKVRKMCAGAACWLCDEGTPLHKDGIHHKAKDGRATFSMCASTKIRQLDLTKDLASCSREEGGDAK